MMDYRDIIQMSAISGLTNGVTAMENDSNGRAVYIGYAMPGSAKSSARWQIRKITYDSNGFITDIQFASGELEFNKIWENRAIYIYS